MSDYFAFFKTDFGIFFYSYDKKMILKECKWVTDSFKVPENMIEKRWLFFEERLKEYFAKKNYFFDLQLDLSGYSDFAKKVLLEIQSIPFGTFVTYSEIANRIKKPNSQRAIGKICKNNKFPIVIPCHRVIAKTGYGGYCGDKSGELFNIKLKLIEHEKSH